MKNQSVLLLALLSFIVLFVSPISGDDSLTCGTDDDVCTIDTDSDSFLTSDYVDEQIKLNMEHSENSLCIVYFYSDTCAHCAAIKPFLEEMEDKYGVSVTITRYNLADPKNVELYYQFCTSKDYKGRSIPVLGINDQIYVGEDQIRDNLETEIQRGSSMEHKICPLGSMSCHAGTSEPGGTDHAFSFLEDLSWQKLMPVVIFAGLADGVNPCAFAVLIFVMTFLMHISSNKRKLVKVTTAYIISVLIVNLLLGVLYYYTSVSLGFPLFFRYLIIGFALIAGLINIKDYFFYGKWFTLKIPGISQGFIGNYAKKATVFSSVILGSAVAILEAPCSIPIYLTVVEVLKAEGRMLIDVFPYMVIYNLMFILPLILLSFLVYFGFEAKSLEKWRDKNKKYMKLVMGIILLGLAIAMITGVL